MVTVIIPTLNEEKQIGEIVNFLKTKKIVTEVIVIDDGSTDLTSTIAKQNGAQVYLSSMLGKGVSMSDGLKLAKNELILFLDGDIYGFSSQLVEKMIEPLLNNTADFVKGKFQRQAGRVTTLTAKPLLKIFFPELSKFQQPLGGIVAGRRNLLQKFTFEADYGVDAGLLIDVHESKARIVEADVGFIEHHHQSLEALSKMSLQITRTILERASKYKKLNISQIVNSVEQERRSGFAFSTSLQKIDPDKKIVLFDMDGTLVDGSFISFLSRAEDREDEVRNFLGRHDIDPIYRTKMIAKALAGIPKSVFEKVAAHISLMPYAQEVIIELKKRGFQVGIITDSYLVAAETIRRRTFADFSVAHFLHFHDGLATGEISISPFMELQNGCSRHSICKSNFVSHLKLLTPGKIPEILSIGNGENDICLFKSSDASFAIWPQSKLVQRAAQQTIDHLSDILQYVQPHFKTGA